MIQPFTSEFLAPTTQLRRLSILLTIHNTPQASQHEIARITHLSSSMVNNYIKLLKNEGVITVSGKTNRTHSYHLTAAGGDELISSLISYSTEIIQLYGAAKRELSQRLRALHSKGTHNIALFGAADTAEVVHAALKDTGVAVRAIVDSDPNKQGKPFNGQTIQPPEVLKDICADAVLITSFARHEEISETIREVVGHSIRVIRISDL